MPFTHYDHNTGVLSRFNPQTKQLESTKVRYLDSPAPVDHAPKLANQEYQNTMAKIFFEILDHVNAASPFGYVIDSAISLDQLPGVRLVDGNLVMYLVRKDKAGGVDWAGNFNFSNAEYRHQLRAFDLIKSFENQTREALIATEVRRILELDKNP